MQFGECVVVDPVDDQPHLPLDPPDQAEAVHENSRENLPQAAVEQEIGAPIVTNCVVDVLDHDEGVLGLPVDGVVEGQEGVAEEVVLFVEQDGGLVGGQHVQVADLDVRVEVVALHVVEEGLEQQRRDAVAAKLAVDAEREDVGDGRALGGLEGIAGQDQPVVLAEGREGLELGHENSDDRELVDRRYADEPLRCRYVDVPKRAKLNF